MARGSREDRKNASGSESKPDPAPKKRGRPVKGDEDHHEKASSPPAKKPRGRPRVADVKSKPAAEKAETETEPLSSDRRPSRKRSCINYRELNERGIKKESDSEDVDDLDDHDAANDIAEVLDSDFSVDFVNLKRRKDGGEEEENSETEEFAFTVPHRKFGKRRIAFSALLQKRAKEKESCEGTYEICKDQICVACAKELDANSLDGLANIFTDKTANGKSLHELFRTLIKQDVEPTYFGSRVCARCLAAMNGIETMFLQYRRAAESFLDTFTLGQKLLDSDAVSAEDPHSLQGITSFINMSKVTVKLIDPTAASFNALAVGYDFQVPVERIHRTSVVSASEIPPESAQEENEDGIITITFDHDTGIIEKAVDFGSSEIQEDEIDLTWPQVYMSPEEFESLKKSLTKNIVYIQTEDFETICSRLLLGQKMKQQFILSKNVSEEYQRQIPGAQAQFTCSDCSTSFTYLHMLSNHIQSTHIATEPDEKEVSSALRTSSFIRTGEVATLEKPFQCNHCDKCFSEYLTLSTHVDHYHGFSRTCNIENCNEVIESIQEFVQHYVTHADVNFKVPTDFHSKTKVVLPCPMCNMTIQGVWKYFHHTYTHEKEARFKCPVCGKRSHKVQNFKDHLLKHNSGSITKDKSGQANGAGSTSFYCTDCGKSFSLLQKLKYHQEVHVPKDLWTFICSACETPFPSESRLKLHVANVHSNVNSECTYCGKILQNRHALQIHVKEEHTESIIIIQQ